MRRDMDNRPYFVGQEIDYSKYIWNCKVHRIIDSEERKTDVAVAIPETEVCFLSESAKMTILIEVSSSFNIERLRNFLAALFTQWNASGSSHVVSIVGFSRSRALRDDYCVFVNNEVEADWSLRLEALISDIEEFSKNLESKVDSKNTCIFSAINCALKIYSRYHLDRDLIRTGLSVVLVSFGNGCYDITGITSLVEKTKRNVIDLGVWLQLVLIGDSPRQACPLLSNKSNGEDIIPYWIDCGYFGEASTDETFCLKGELQKCDLCDQRWNLYPQERICAVPKNFSWETLKTPPCLPLSYKASSGARLKLKERAYKVYPDTNSPFLSLDGVANELEMLKRIAAELVMVRINQGFQIQAPLNELKQVLSLGHEIHEIEVNKRNSFITVTIKNIQESVQSDYDYEFFLDGESRLVNFTANKEYDWETLDNFICGTKTDFAIDGVWQSRYMLVPDRFPLKISLIDVPEGENLDEDDQRIISFTKFINLITGTNPDSLGIQFVTSRLSSILASIPATNTLKTPNDEKGDSVSNIEALRRETPIDEILRLMQNPLIGLPSKRRRWYWQLYDNVFLGSEAVDWLLKFFEDIKDRQEAVEFGKELMDLGVWEHVQGKHGFIDGHFFYRLRGFNNYSREEISHVVELSREMLQEICMESGPRKEWAILHYDTNHCTRAAFHFDLFWLNCSSRLLETMVRTWGQWAKRLGFSLLEIPAIPPSNNHLGPFDQFRTVKLAVQPPKVAFLKAHYPQCTHTETLLVEEFLVYQGFVLDLEPDSRFASDDPDKHFRRAIPRPPVPYLQYVHLQGVAIVQIVEMDDGEFSFIWSRNKLLHTGQHETIFRNFERTCSDENGLREFWNGLTHTLATAPTSIRTIL